MKNPAAVELGKLVGAGLTKEQRQEKGRNGGLAGAANLSEEERTARARKAARARWDKGKRKRKASSLPTAPSQRKSVKPKKKGKAA